MENPILNSLEQILKEISIHEKRGLDSSSLKIFINNFKQFLKYNEDLFIVPKEFDLTEKLKIIKEFLDDRQAFPTIGSVIEFANKDLELDFKSQKESRETTISRILGRIQSKPELKDRLKASVIKIRNEKVHASSSQRSKKEVISADTFNKWAEIIKNI